jgi:hypothetical protein
MEQRDEPVRAAHEFADNASADHRSVELRLREFLRSVPKTPLSKTTLPELELALFLESEFDIALGDKEIQALDRQDPRGIGRTVVRHLTPGNGGG